MTIIEALVALCVIGVLIGVVISRYQRVAREAKNTAVKAELSNMRSSITLFKLLNNRNPASLSELMEKNVMWPARTGSDPAGGPLLKRKYLMSIAGDGKGSAVDAFGNSFCYDPVRGEVKSSTKGCDVW